MLREAACGSLELGSGEVGCIEAVQADKVQRRRPRARTRLLHSRDRGSVGRSFGDFRQAAIVSRRGSEARKEEDAEPGAMAYEREK